MHVIPFNAVTTISNASRGIGNAPVSVTVPFYEDSDRIAAALTEIAAEMRHEPRFRAADARRSEAAWGGRGQGDGGHDYR